MLISEQLFLLLTKDDGAAESAFSMNAYGLAGAVIADLVAAGRITLSEDKDPKVHVLDPGPTGDPVLDHALDRIRQREGKKLSSLITDGKVNPESQVVESLTRRGVITVEPKRFLGLVPEKRPTADPAPERAIRERLRVVLAGGTPTVEEATLLSILHGLDLVSTVLKEETAILDKKALKARIEEAASEVPQGTAIAKSIEAFNLIMLTAVIIPAVTSTSSS